MYGNPYRRVAKPIRTNILSGAGPFCSSSPTRSCAGIASCFAFPVAEVLCWGTGASPAPHSHNDHPDPRDGSRQPHLGCLANVTIRRHLLGAGTHRAILLERCTLWNELTCMLPSPLQQNPTRIGPAPLPK
jgi:hypothetical protein